MKPHKELKCYYGWFSTIKLPGHREYELGDETLWRPPLFLLSTESRMCRRTIHHGRGVHVLQRRFRRTPKTWRNVCISTRKRCRINRVWPLYKWLRLLTVLYCPCPEFSLHVFCFNFIQTWSSFHVLIHFLECKFAAVTDKVFFFRRRLVSISALNWYFLLFFFFELNKWCNSWSVTKHLKQVGHVVYLKTWCCAPNHSSGAR